MTRSYVQVDADGAGKKVATAEFAQGADTVEAELVVPVDDSGNALYVDQWIATTNSSTTALEAGASFVGTATDLANYAGLVVKIYGTPSTAQGSFFFEFSDDNVNWDTSVPTLIDDPTYVIPTRLITVGRYFRVRYLNDGGVAAGGSAAPVAQTAFRLNTQLYRLPPTDLGRTLAQTIKDNQPVTLTRSVLMGKNPQGGYVNLPATGRITNSPATALLAAGATYTSAWYPTVGWSAISLLIATDQISAVNGVDIQFSDDGSTLRTHKRDSLRASDVTAGSYFLPFPPHAEYFRLVYTNGPSPQGTFFVNLTMGVTSFEDDLPKIVAWTEGIYGGQAGVSGTVNVPAGAVVTGAAAQSGTVLATVTVPGVTGAVQLPGSNQQSTDWAITPPPQSMVGPVTFIFSNTATYQVEWVL